MSARWPFATVNEFDEGVWIVDSPDEARSADVYAVCRDDKAEAERIAATLNRAVADRVAAELEAAAEDATEESQSSPLLSPKCVAAWLRARAKARREGGGK